MNVTIVSFIVFLALMTLCGAGSIIHKKKNPRDYLTASQEIKPWLSALSTVATNNSGFMFIGMIAYTYRLGIESIWMMVGWIGGDFLAWLWVHPRVRTLSSQLKCNTIPDLLGQPINSNNGKSNRAVIVAAGLITFVFLGIYAAAQLKAGSTALHVLFDWNLETGTLIGAGIVILYSYAGGIRADIWTDAAQSFVMLVSMTMILVAGYLKIGGFGALIEQLEQIDPSLIRWFPDELEFGIAAFVIGFFFAGFGVVGQPHLMTRLLAIDSVQSIKRARLYYFAWFIPFFLASIGVGLYCRAILPDLASAPLASSMDEPTELALPMITMELLPEVFIGLALAGLFAATVSTADSQIIVCSGAVTHDVRPAWRNSYLASKLATLSITLMALIIALYAPEGVFSLVLIAWSALGSALGPLLVLRVFNRPISSPKAIIMMVVAISAVIGWHLSGFDDDVFKMLPGMLSAVFVYILFPDKWLNSH